MNNGDYWYTAEPNRKGKYSLFLYLFKEDEVIIYENLFHRDLKKEQAGFLRSRYYNENPIPKILTKEWGFLEACPKEAI